VRPHYIVSIVFVTIFVGCSISLKDPIVPVANTYYLHEGVNIHFKDVGRGRPIVFIHGFGASLDSWRFMVESLKNEYRLVLLDLKGHGFSDRPYDEKYSVQDHARVVLGLIRYLGLDDVVIVGHSFGSVVALAAALEARKTSAPAVAGLVLIAGTVDGDNLPSFLRLLRTPLIGWLSVKLTSAPFRTRLMLKRAYYDDRKVTESLVELYAQYQEIAGTEYAMLRTAAQLVPANFLDLKEDLSKL
jgi:pimeloyl-ACP methyl ester carboxylesterase